MNIAITGAGGFLGSRLATAMLADAGVRRIVLCDVAFADAARADDRVVLLAGNLTDPGIARRVTEGADAVFHLAAVVSGQAEAEFDTGMRVNLDATRCLLEAARAGGLRPKFIFASSLAVFGQPLPATITDGTAVHPQSSYGTQKAIGELLVADYSRKGFVDGRVLRLPTVCVRPGKPNAATSSFVSSIIREPLHGENAVCPVGRELELWLTSPSSAIANLCHGASLPPDALGSDRILNLPGITVSVAGMIESLARVAGPEAAARITFRDEPLARRIVSSWPARFDVARAVALGFRRDRAFDDLVREFVADEAAAKEIRLN